MPISHPENKMFAMDAIIKIAPKSILDIGAGAGQYAHLFKSLKSHVFMNDTKIHAIEVWKTYVEDYVLDLLYDKVMVKDVLEHDDFNYDLVIAGDVLEHLEEKDALMLYEKIKSQAKYCLFSIPIMHMPQGAQFGNPYEVHKKEDWTHQEILNKFSNIFLYYEGNVVGSYLAKFRDDK